MNQSRAWCWAAAAALAVPVGTILWGELLYLAFGLTGEDGSPAVNAALFLVAFGLAFGWPLPGAQRPAEVVRQSCNLGVVAALLLPVVAVAVLLLWESAPARRDLGMGGLIFYGMPVIAMAGALAFSVLFWFGGWLALRRLRQKPSVGPIRRNGTSAG